MILQQFCEPQIPPNQIIVKFGAGINSDVQGRALLHLERYLREVIGIPALVFKETKVDDLKRRRDMTTEERAKL